MRASKLLWGWAMLSAAVQAQSQEPPASNLVNRPVNAIGYQMDSGTTKVDLKGTDLAPNSSGSAWVAAKKGITNLEVKIEGLPEATRFGTEFLTYVLWAVSPDGRTSNLGEVLVNKDGNGKVEVTTQFLAFSLLVTAEPYFSVRQPSEVVVLENQIRKDTKGRLFVVSDYKLMRRAQYEKLGNPLALTPDLKKVPLEMYEARNAVDIAKSRGADKYAPEIFSKAQASLAMAENALARKANKKEVSTAARQAVQFSEDARALAVQRAEDARIAQDRADAAAKARAEAEARAAVQAAEAKQRTDTEAQRQAELAAAREAQMKAEAAAAQAKAQAEAAAAEARAQSEAAAADAKAKAELAAANAAADALRIREEAAKAEAERIRVAAEALRAELLDQFNRILETRDTVRGLVVNLGDVLFDTAKYDLRPLAREKLARLAGIVLAHPGLSLEVEGHTDSVGPEELNQTLSEHRAGAVRTYLIEQGLTENQLTAKGFGESLPVADNTTAEGRQKNRRVEIIVSGEVIGTRIGR